MSILSEDAAVGMMSDLPLHEGASWSADPEGAIWPPGTWDIPARRVRTRQLERDMLRDGDVLLFRETIRAITRDLMIEATEEAHGLGVKKMIVCGPIINLGGGSSTPMRLMLRYRFGDAA